MVVEVVVEGGAGLDVHKATAVVTVHTPQVRETRTYGTMTGNLRELGKWLESLGVTHVAMESTGPYLEARVQRAGGVRLRACGAQRPAHEGGAGAQDRSQGLGIDVRPVAARIAAGQLHPL